MFPFTLILTFLVSSIRPGGIPRRKGRYCILAIMNSNFRNDIYIHMNCIVQRGIIKIYKLSYFIDTNYSFNVAPIMELIELVYTSKLTIK